MNQNELRPPAGAKHKRKRVGRGNGSGHGTYSGRGCKGQNARSGGGVRPGFEGGQLPIIKRLPKRRGFTNIFKIEYNIVNVGELDIFSSGSVVTPRELLRAGLIKSPNQPVKVLGDGKISHPLTVRADKVSATAQRKILAVGGKVERT